MASISYSKRGEWQELIVSLNKYIIFVNPNDLQIFKEITIPDDLTKCGLIETHAEEDTPNSKAKITHEPPTIQHVQLSPNGLLLAVTCSGQKALLIYECRPENAKIISVRSLARASSAISFSASSKLILVTDKTGDCYLFDCEKLQEPGKLILGHLSVVYDVLLTPDEKYVITCDRDDKIKVSNFPNCYDIEGYCLGHKEFVSSIKLLPNDSNVLLSISGDKTIKLWNYRESKKLCEFNLPAPGIKCCIKKVSDNLCHLSVLVYQPNESVVTYEIVKDDQNDYHIKETSRHTFGSTIVTSICYAGEKLYVLGVRDERLVIDLIAEEKSETSVKVLDMINEYFKNEVLQPEDISGWFKKNFDNVTEYYERKKRRIEEKLSKNEETV